MESVGTVCIFMIGVQVVLCCGRAFLKKYVDKEVNHIEYWFTTLVLVLFVACCFIFVLNEDKGWQCNKVGSMHNTAAVLLTRFGKRRAFAYTGWWRVCDLGGVGHRPSYLENSQRLSKLGKMSPLCMVYIRDVGLGVHPFFKDFKDRF